MVCRNLLVRTCFMLPNSLIKVIGSLFGTVIFLVHVQRLLGLDLDQMTN